MPPISSIAVVTLSVKIVTVEISLYAVLSNLRDYIFSMLRVWSDILTAANRRQVTLLGLLDLSVAFDCVDHDNLLQRFQIGLGMSDVVLRWIQSLLTNRTQEVIQWSAIQ